jgi:hypothetical protein
MLGCAPHTEPELRPSPFLQQKAREMSPSVPFSMLDRANDVSTVSFPTFSCTAPHINDLYSVNQFVFGHKQYIQYIPGDAPLILGAPHGGILTPKQDFPNIVSPIYKTDAKGVTVKDANGNPVPTSRDSRDGNSLEKTMEVAHAIYKMTGKQPHIIINHVIRGRLQLNSNKAVSTRGKMIRYKMSNGRIGYKYPHPANAIAEKAWEEYHLFVKAAKDWVIQHCQRGLYVDMHTNGRAVPRTEFGYILTNDRLKRLAPRLPSTSEHHHHTGARWLPGKERFVPLSRLSSLRALVALPWNASVSLRALLSGPMSLGGMLQKDGYLSLPGPVLPYALDGKYYTGGHNIRAHSSIIAGDIDAVQIESHFDFINNNNRGAYSQKLAASLVSFVQRFYRFQLSGKGTIPKHSTCKNAKVLSLPHSSSAATPNKTISFRDSLWGASNEFQDGVSCNLQTVRMEGPQLYYKISLQKGYRYTFTIQADFYARLYLFQGVCQAASISSSCAKTGMNGASYARHNVPMSETFSPSKTGDFFLTVDSRKASWFGTFQLTVLSTKL